MRQQKAIHRTHVNQCFKAKHGAYFLEKVSLKIISLLFPQLYMLQNSNEKESKYCEKLLKKKKNGAIL